MTIITATTIATSFTEIAMFKVAGEVRVVPVDRALFTEVIV
jgi:hypothetical protein